MMAFQQENIATKASKFFSLKATPQKVVGLIFENTLLASLQEVEINHLLPPVSVVKI